jgi:hypothetical protein
MDITQIIFTALPILLGIGFIWARIEKVMKALTELADVISVINASLADKALSKEEVEAIKKEINDAITAFKQIFKK